MHRPALINVTVRNPQITTFKDTGILPAYRKSCFSYQTIFEEVRADNVNGLNRLLLQLSQGSIKRILVCLIDIFNPQGSHPKSVVEIVYLKAFLRLESCTLNPTSRRSIPAQRFLNQFTNADCSLFVSSIEPQKQVISSIVTFLNNEEMTVD